MFSTLKYFLSFYFLKLFGFIYSPYKIIKRTPSLKWSSIAAIVLLLIILFFWRDSTASLNPYEVLGVSKGFTKRELSKAYRNLAIQFDPDLHKDDSEKQKKYLQLTKAYEMYLFSPEIFIFFL